MNNQKKIILDFIDELIIYIELEKRNIRKLKNDKNFNNKIKLLEDWIVQVSRINYFKNINLISFRNISSNKKLPFWIKVLKNKIFVMFYVVSILIVLIYGIIGEYTSYTTFIFSKHDNSKILTSSNIIILVLILFILAIFIVLKHRIQNAHKKTTHKSVNIYDYIFFLKSIKTSLKNIKDNQLNILFEQFPFTPR